MSKLTLNSISTDIFRVNANETMDNNSARADIVASGRMLYYDYACRGQKAVRTALNSADATAQPVLSDIDYKQMNERFQRTHLLYCAKKACEATGRTAPENFEEFKRNGMTFYNDQTFWRVLQGVYEEIITPILPRVYSEALSVFAEVQDVEFAQTLQLDLQSNDIPVFQDTAWGAQRSIPQNRFYDKSVYLNPQPKSCTIVAKWTQIVGNNMDFGRFFANLTAGWYAKTMGMWNAAMTALASDTTLIPTGLTGTFSDVNWITIANKVSALNNVPMGNIIAFGGAVGLSKVLPTQATGSSNTAMDAALATLLGADYIRSGYLGEFLGVRLMPLVDAVVPGSQYGTVTTILDQSKIWMMSASGRKPLTIAMNSNSPISFEITPERSADFQIGINMTMALDIAAVVSDKIGLITIS